MDRLLLPAFIAVTPVSLFYFMEMQKRNSSLVRQTLNTLETQSIAVDKITSRIRCSMNQMGGEADIMLNIRTRDGVYHEIHVQATRNGIDWKTLLLEVN